LPLRIRGDQVRVRGVVVGILRKYGFTSQEAKPKVPARCDRPRPVAIPERPGPRDDGATLEITLNAIDAQLTRWKSLLAREERSMAANERARMAQLGRDLQALRDWSARTSKPTLRHALIVEANQLISRMHRLARSRSLELPEATLH